jgi:adrenodoxin-NADP+ reductase
MLLTPPAALEKYEIPEPVLEVLRGSAVRHVSIIGRRGPLQAAFTNKELRELTSLNGASMDPLAPELLAPAPDVKLTRQQSRLVQLLQLQQQQQKCDIPTPHTKSWSLDFFRSPTALTPAPSRHQNKLALTLAHTALDASVRAVPTGATSVLHTDLVVAALGHRADPAQAYVDPALGHMRAAPGGRVLDGNGCAVRRVYASGWAATGARGVLASTMLDAYAVADSILSDYQAGDAGGASEHGSSDDVLIADDVVDLESVPREVEEGVRARRVVQYEQWKEIDEAEAWCGAEAVKERERMDWEEAHELLTSSRSQARQSQ